jgi:hypothetical protein
MAPLTSELSILLKDGVRGARYVFRKGTRIGREGSTISPAVPKLARLADSVFTATEKAAAALLSSEGDDLATAEAFAESFSAMLSTANKDEFRALFVRLLYRLAEATLTRLGVENAFISAHEIAAACWLLQQRHRKTLAAVAPRRPLNMAAVARFWASTLICLEQRRAIREIDLPQKEDFQKRFLETAPETYCLLIMVIAGATLTTRDLAGLAADPDRLAHSFEDFIDSAVVVVSARFDRLAAHMAAPDAIDLLSADLEALLPFLP